MSSHSTKIFEKNNLLGFFSNRLNKPPKAASLSSRLMSTRKQKSAMEPMKRFSRKAGKPSACRGGACVKEPKKHSTGTGEFWGAWFGWVSSVRFFGGVVGWLLGWSVVLAKNLSKSSNNLCWRVQRVDHRRSLQTLRSSVGPPALMCCDL